VVGLWPQVRHSLGPQLRAAKGDEQGEPTQADQPFARGGDEAEFDIYSAANGEDGDHGGADEHQMPQGAEIPDYSGDRRQVNRGEYFRNINAREERDKEHVGQRILRQKPVPIRHRQRDGQQNHETVQAKLPGGHAVDQIRRHARPGQQPRSR